MNGPSWWRSGDPGEGKFDRVARPMPPRITESQTFVVPPILGCLDAAESFLDGMSGKPPVRRQWGGKTEIQRLFVEMYSGLLPEVGSIGDVLKSIAHPDVNMVNGWLKEHGFDIKLNPVTGESFAVASILDVLVEWLASGAETTVTAEGKEYPAVIIKGGFVGMTPSPGNHGHPVAQLLTKSREKVYVTIADGVDASDVFGMARKIQELSDDLRFDTSYGSVVFPMVDYDRQVDISWIEGLTLGDTGWYVDQAVQQTKFRMNEKGARAQSAAAMMTRCLQIEEPILIDRPFLLWIEREGSVMPLFAGVFAEDSWKKPRSLS